MTNEQLFHLSKVAEKTGLSERSLADAARANKMPHYKINGRRYMSQAQIDDYIASTLVQVPLPKRSREVGLRQALEEEKARRSRAA